MRIAMVTETYPPEVNGVARTIGLMAEGLQRRGHFVELVRPRQTVTTRPCVTAASASSWSAGSIPRYTQLKMGMPSRRTLSAAGKKSARTSCTWRPKARSAGPRSRRAARHPRGDDFHTNFHAYTRDYGLGWLARPVAAYLHSFHNRAACTMVPTREIAAELAAQRFERLRVVGRVNPEVFSPARRSPSCVRAGAPTTARWSRCASAASRTRRTSRSSFRRTRPCAHPPRHTPRLVGDGPS